jgi:predicted AlkP superfamily pyrophosphatase or phosphodiesterase
VTDYLAVSFSSTDYVGHLFGPSSLEAEDNLLRLDRTLAGLLAYIDKKVGLDQTMVVLSADHGGPEAPADMQQYGFEVDYVDPESWEKEAAFTALKRRFGIDKELIWGCRWPRSKQRSPPSWSSSTALPWRFPARQWLRGSFPTRRCCVRS